MLILIFIILFSTEQVSGEDLKSKFSEIPIFQRTVLSKKIIPICEYNKGDETGIFSITYKKNKITNLFLIMKGLDPETCKWHVEEIKKLKSKSRLLTLSGRGGSLSSNTKDEMVWTWQSVKSDKNCHGYFDHDCSK